MQLRIEELILLLGGNSKVPLYEEGEVEKRCLCATSTASLPRLYPHSGRIR